VSRLEVDTSARSGLAAGAHVPALEAASSFCASLSSSTPPVFSARNHSIHALMQAAVPRSPPRLKIAREKPTDEPPHQPPYTPICAAFLAFLEKEHPEIVPRITEREATSKVRRLHVAIGFELTHSPVVISRT